MRQDGVVTLGLPHPHCLPLPTPMLTSAHHREAFSSWTVRRGPPYPPPTWLSPTDIKKEVPQAVFGYGKGKT